MKRLTPFTLAMAAALGIAAAPAPAAADSSDIAKIIAGLAVAGIVAKAIDDRNDRKSAVTSNSSRINTFNGLGTIDGNLRSPNRAQQPAKRGYKQVALPDQCLRILDTARGDRRVYGARCLQRNHSFANKLPSDCAFRVRTDRGLRTVYGRRCLSQDGWYVAGRR